jgi:phage anti-repressor protein
MEELIRLNENGGDFPIDARELHEKLFDGQEHFTRFNDWINNRIKDYGFVEGQDFYSELSKSTGGRRAVEYHLTIDMGKELAMLENNEKGRMVRKYFIAVEKAFRQTNAIKLVSKEVRRELTDALRDSGLNEKMHGFGYKTFTDLVYKMVIGMSAKQFRTALNLPKDANVREHISEFQRQQVAKIERAVQSFIDCGFDYNEIKSMLESKALSTNKVGLLS